MLTNLNSNMVLHQWKYLTLAQMEKVIFKFQYGFTSIESNRFKKIDWKVI